MAVSRQELQNAQNGAIWSGTSGGVTHFIRKINGNYEVWNSEASGSKYQVTIDQAVTYGNQYNMQNRNNTSTPTQRAPAAAAPAPANTGNNNRSNDDSASSNNTTPRTTETTTVRVAGKRLENPLGWLPSYTYQISLYMITPDAYSAFSRSGGKDINAFRNAPSITEVDTSAMSGGAFLIAQSGGRSVEDKSEFFPFDYGIDNLSIDTASPTETGAATAAFEFSLRIVEPYGFSFVSNLKRARDALEEYTNAYQKAREERTKAANKGRKKKIAGPPQPLKNFFVLGIRFFGWDEEGNPIKGDDVRNDTPIDPNSTSEILFERFFPIRIFEFKSQLDGKNQVYNMKGANVDAALGQNATVGVVKNDIKIIASTVGEALDNFAEELNKQMDSLKNKNKMSKFYNYSFNYQNDEAAEILGNASMLSKADIQKWKWPGSKAKTSKQSNDATALKNYRVTDQGAEFTITKGTPILKAVDRIVAQSQFLEAALEVVYDTSLEANDDKDDFNSLPNPNPQELQWYFCTPKTYDPEWSEEINNWVYDTSYVLNLYKTPCTFTPNTKSKNTTRYYGPIKKYEYWYSGGNTSVIKYEYNYNLNFFNALPGGEATTGENSNDDGAGNAAKGLGDRIEEPVDGKPGLGMATQQSYQTNLYDPDGYVNAKLTIIGDPDFLADPGSPTAAPLSRNPDPNAPVSLRTVGDQFYGRDGYTMNLSGGQAFIEVLFLEAVDYDEEQGIMIVNDSIQFYEDINPQATPNTRYKDNRAAEGISHSITSIKSTFNGGFFQQYLVLKPSEFNNPDTITTQREKKKSSGRQKTNSGPAPKKGTATTTNTGLKSDAYYNPNTVSSYFPSKSITGNPET